MVRLESVTKTYGQAVVIDDLSLHVEAGRTLALIGPSGCGKSTLLRMLIGLVRPDRGRVAVDGDSPLEAGDTQSVQRRIGYVIQDGGLFPHLTARDNVALAARHFGWKEDRVQARIAELAALTRFPLDGLARHPVQLSGGQRQRVALMRALMIDPDLLLLDEPLAALDPMIRRTLQEDLRGIIRSLQKTVILVTHDLHEAAYFADEVVLLRRGRIEQQGVLADLVERPASAFVSEFVQAQRGADFGVGP